MVKVYYGNISPVKESEIFQQCLERVDERRRNKISRCKQNGDKYRSLLAGVLLRYGLEQEGIAYETVVFAENSHGKPFLKSPEGIFFSISHSEDYVVCAFSTQNLGVDIEDRQRICRKKAMLEKIAKRSFTEDEYIRYENIQNFVEKCEYFLRLWTRKESCSKAVGLGLGMDFSQMDVSSDEAEVQFWSGWLTSDMYLSIYQESEWIEPVVLQEVDKSLIEQEIALQKR